MQTKKIKNINEWQVLTANGWKNFGGIQKSENSPILQTITFEDDTYLKCTPGHPIKISNTFIEASDLLVGDIISNKKIKSINFERGNFDVYDLIDVDGEEYLVNNINVHNCAFIENVDDIWASAQQTLATGGRAIILSTPNGVGGFFHKTWIDAEQNLNGFNTIKLDWRVHPERDQAWRDKQDEILGPKLAAQECDASFVSSGNSVVPPDILDWYDKTMTMEPIEKRGIDSSYWIWQYPDYSKSYVVSADVARGDGGDYSALQVIDVDTLEQVAEYKGKIGTKEFGNFCVTVATEYNNALLVIENANVGWAVLQEAIDRDYQNLFYSSKDLAIVDSSVSIVKRMDLKEKSQLTAGFTTTQRTKPLIISKMDTYLRGKEVTLRSKRLIQELFTYIYNGSRTEAMTGYNDDLVMAYAIAMWVRDTAIRLRQEGIEIQKATLAGVNKVSPVIMPNAPKNNPWDWSVGKQKEDLTWLL